MIDFECPHCGKAIHVSPSSAGKKGFCRKCGNLIVVPLAPLPLAKPTQHLTLTPAQLLLLSKFRKSDLPRTYHDAEHWKIALNESPSNVIEQFMKSGLLEPGGLQERLDYQFKAADLKPLLKERGLKVSGRKEELIQRLIDNDPNGMFDVTKGLELLRCSKSGAQLTQEYLEVEEVRRTVAEKEVLHLLASHEYLQAARAVGRYESMQVFPRGVGIDWKTYDGVSDAESLETIFNTTPSILKGISEDRMKLIRIAASMMHLWGAGRSRDWLPHDFETGIHFDGDTACRMFVFHASHFRSIEAYRKCGVKTVQILGTHDGISCKECRKLAGKKFPVGQVPELPNPNCTCEIGCRCTTVAHFR